MTVLEPAPQRRWIACAEEHPLIPGLLCPKLSGHWPATLHDDGEGNRWGETP